MKFIILGSGGRENAIVKKLYLDKNKYNLVCISNILNPDIQNMVSEYVLINNIYDKNLLINKIQKIYYNNKQETILVPSSEKFLEIGIVDLAFKFGIPSIGPFKNLALIETSKSFCRNYLKYNHLDEMQPKYEIFFDYNENKILNTIKSFNFNFVVKADGLCSGKGVRVYDKNGVKDALDYCKELFSKETDFLNPIKILIEERKFGSEFSLLSFCDGVNIKHMPIVQDYKDLKKGSTIKTGGMGSIILKNHSFPFLTDEDVNKCQNLNNKLMLLLSRDENKVYKGILYGGFIKTKDGVFLIEYNARFGDPESINILSLLETSLADIFKSIISGTLNNLDINYKNEYSVCTYLVPEGYPNYIDSKSYGEIKIPESKNIYLASVDCNENKIFLNKSRSIAVCYTSPNLHNCISEVYNLINLIEGPLYYRNDIGDLYIQKDNYLESGVNIEEGDRVVQKIESEVSATYDKNVINKFGDFGCIYDIHQLIKDKKYEHPVLLSSTDGVGTKTKLVLKLLGEKDGLVSLGKDIVNHSVNDILVKGGEPIFFMDYVASSQISSDNILYLVKGISESCLKNNMSLLGGETAEMPNIYNYKCYDIVGTILGICDKCNIIDGTQNIKNGDLVFGILSDGPHTNGYSLIRKILDEKIKNYDRNTMINGFNITEFIKPHKSYLEDYKLFKEKNIEINGLCHITGGGYQGNIVRILPEHLAVELNIKILEPFASLQRLGNLSNEEMYKVFNCGYGMLVFTSSKKEEVLKKTFCQYLGKVILRDGKDQVIFK